MQTYFQRRPVLADNLAARGARLHVHMHMHAHAYARPSPRHAQYVFQRNQANSTVSTSHCTI